MGQVRDLYEPSAARSIVSFAQNASGLTETRPDRIRWRGSTSGALCGAVDPLRADMPGASSEASLGGEAPLGGGLARACCDDGSFCFLATLGRAGALCPSELEPVASQASSFLAPSSPKRWGEMGMVSFEKMGGELGGEISEQWALRDLGAMGLVRSGSNGLTCK